MTLSTTAVTKGGVEIGISTTVLDPTTALKTVFAKIDHHKGAILSSGFDYPGRHSRWEFGFVNPAVEFITHKKQFEFNALNEQGVLVLTSIADALKSNKHIQTLDVSQRSIKGAVKEKAKHFSEEERSRQSSIFSVLRSVMQHLYTDHQSASSFGFYGALGYDLIQQFEDIELKLPRSKDGKDCHLFLPLEVIVIDRKKEVAIQYSYSLKTKNGDTSEKSADGAYFELPLPTGADSIDSDHQPGEFAAKVQKVIEGTKRGDYFEVVLSQTFSTAVSATPTSLFGRLSELNPSPYMFLMNFGDEQLIGASPEICIRLTSRFLETCPIAGTIRRGATPLEDADKVKELIASEKEESELTMCTDVDRNDMARVCKPGSIKILGRRQLEFYSHLIHTVDHLQGELEDCFDGIDAFEAHMWPCTITGAPKPAAVQEIENLEKSPREWYSGAIGGFMFNGNVNTGITIRTAHLKNGRASIRAGATLLYGSDPQEEEGETRTKAAAFLTALTKSDKVAPRKTSSAHFALEVEEKVNKRVLLVDYRDSFVHNLAAYLRQLGADVKTYRPGFPLEILKEVDPQLVFLSPGPCRPEDFQMGELIRELVRLNYPIFGVCLGHQGIGEFFGATLAQLSVPGHGKPATVKHSGGTLFQGISDTFEAGRYHSLHLLADSIPQCLKVTATSSGVQGAPQNADVVMAIEHKELPIAGVQFHPESLMTLKGKVGHLMLLNVLQHIAKK